MVGLAFFSILAASEKVIRSTESKVNFIILIFYTPSYSMSFITNFLKPHILPFVFTRLFFDKPPLDLLAFRLYTLYGYGIRHSR